MSICLKELREAHRWMRLIKRVPLLQEMQELERLMAESEQLIRIFVASIQTAKNVRRPPPEAKKQEESDS
jgi:four helix bundle protein